MILEKGIPIPQRTRGKWDFLNDMGVGDSIITTTPRDFENVRSAMRHRKMRYRSVKEANRAGWRIWRIN